MKGEQFWEKLYLNLNQKLILIIVSKHEGSSPGKQGFKMFVDKDGNTFGTIGGGIMEANIIKKAEEMLKENVKEAKLVIQVHNKKATSENQSGLICAGKQWIVMVPLSQDDHDTTNTIWMSFATQEPEYFEITSNAFHIISQKDKKEDFYFEDRESWYYQEKVGDSNVVHLFGGGHVGDAIGKILNTLDFHIIQYDNRYKINDETLAEMIESFGSDPVYSKIGGSFMESAPKVKSGPKVYVIVTTYSFDTDYQVLMNVLEKRVNYIGLMGSKTKIAKIFQMLRDDGFSRDLIKLIKAPIGLDISDGSIEEIAISVVAEILKIKNNPELGIY